MSLQSAWIGCNKSVFFHVRFRTGRPVRFALERNMDMLITGGRHPFFGKYKVSERRRYFAQLLGDSFFWGKSASFHWLARCGKKPNSSSSEILTQHQPCLSPKSTLTNTVNQNNSYHRIPTAYAISRKSRAIHPFSYSKILLTSALPHPQMTST